jgi:tetratricopeptide (TPR) repeat protein
MMKSILASVLVATSLVTPAAAQTDTNPLAAARELYASARYDEALAVLNGLRPGEPTTVVDRKSIEQYRSLCLLALGRGSEAEAAIAAVITADPMYQPTEAEASPRVRTAFSEVRQRLLPEIAATRYGTAKAAFDRKDYASAEKQFRQLITLLDDPDVNGKFGDMRTLAVGFLELSVAAAVPPPPPAPKPAASVAQSAPPPVSPARVYLPEDAGVVPPVAIRQELPRVPNAISQQTRSRGLLEIVVDELGRVAGITMRLSIHPVYDTLVMTAARDWRYRPATLGGKPVKYRKLIQISLARP